MKKTWKPVTAGIIDLLSAAFGLLSVIGLVVSALLFALNPSLDPSTAKEPITLVPMLWIMAVIYLIFSVFSAIGGIYNLLRKKWVLAMIGSVCSFIPLFFLSIASIVLTALSRDEFNQQ